MKMLDLPDYLVPEIDSSSFRFIANNSILNQDAPWVQLPNWHQNIPVVITFEATFDLEQILTDTGLDKGSVIACGITATSSRTKSKVVSKLTKLGDEKTVVTLDIEGQQTGGDLRIEAFLTVKEANAKVDYATTAPGKWAILWSQQSTCHLEGNQARAEIHPANFKNTDHKKALWIIHEDFPRESEGWLTCEINNAINVEYNEDQATFISDQIGIQLLTSAYAETILDAAIATDGVLEMMFDETLPYESRGSLLRTSHSLIQSVLGSNSPEVIRSNWARAKNRFITKLQHMVGGN